MGISILIEFENYFILKSDTIGKSLKGVLR
jgi:hypothetical protein